MTEPNPLPPELVRLMAEAAYGHVVKIMPEFAYACAEELIAALTAAAYVVVPLADAAAKDAEIERLREALRAARDAIDMSHVARIVGEVLDD